MRHLLLALFLVVSMIGTAVPATAEGPTPATPIIVGDPLTMHRQVLAQVRDRTGAEPVRLATGEDPVLRTIQISRHANPYGADTVYLASDETFADALAAAPLLRQDGAALLLTDPARLATPVREELVRLAPDDVVILGGRAAVAADIEGAVRDAVPARVRRVAATNRYATAAAVAREAQPGTARTVFLATGATFADALAAMPAVDVDEGVLLLTDPGRLPPETASALARLDPSRLLVLGGPAAIEQTIVEAVKDLVRATPLRLAGPNRYSTADAINGYVQARSDGGRPLLYAVDGNAWRDAMAIGPAVAGNNAGLMVLNTAVVFPPPDLTGAMQVAAARQGQTSFQVMGTGGRTAGYQPERVVAAVSTLKIMFLVGYLRQADVAGRALTEADRALLEPMITRSENTTASTINRQLGTPPLNEIAGEVGMQDFRHVPSPWGNTRTSARDQIRLMAELPRLLPDRHREYALDLLTRIVPEQRWGVGQVPFPGWTLRFKGGWGSATGSVNHQSVRLEHRTGAVVVLAVTTTDSPSHAYASDTLELVFRELLATLP